MSGSDQNNTPSASDPGGGPQPGPFGVVREGGSSERVRVLVAAFEGWNDAGDAATDTVKFLRENYSAREIFEVSPDEYYDYQYSRPQMTRSATGEPKLVWPSTKLSAASVEGTNLDLVLLHGWEPSYRWRGFCAEILEQAARMDVDFIVMVGALLADVPHTRPIPVSITSDTEELQDELDVTGSEYEGPSGIVGVLSHLAAVSGIPTVSLWAAVPHYVAQPPSPKAQLALMRRLEDLLTLSFPLEELEEDAEAWERGVNELAEDDPEIAAYVAKLEEAKDTTDLPEASGDAIAQEFERFLRRREQD
ncbi:PAC2 family protein [Kocuria sp. JC486]|uniref:PAC2 family protein n=1 Tax=Kocuria soli TaxID=2485125 RepID=A0A3N3ZUQ0_9MICC|nr:PAC2 family protein [Kocuria soli]NHU84288.1 PAC2 family protein [Kocuria sp. JC486]ROZ63737.1 PAC2 family protein [Kocuria soli]